MAQVGTEEPLPLTVSELNAAKVRVQRFHAHLVDDFDITSLPDADYNCVAWAAGDVTRNWWPTGGYWPVGAERKRSVESFIAVFSDRGYEVCASGEFEPGYEKVVIFTKDTRPTHMARQFPSGKWTSKTGEIHDICLTDLERLTGGHTGKIDTYMRRKLDSPAPFTHALRE